MFITVLTSARHLSVSWANSIHSSQPPPTSWRSILILSSHLRLGLPDICPTLILITLYVKQKRILLHLKILLRTVYAQVSGFFFLFYWCYNPLWVLAFSVIFFHSALSLHNFLHLLTPIICISFSMSSIYLFLGLPLLLLPVGFHSSTLLGILFPSIRITWSSQAILLLLYKSHYICVFYWVVQLVINSDSPESIFILHWTKDFSQYSALK